MKTKYLILTALFAALTAIGAFIRIPTPISSFTLQFFFTCMAGLLLGPRWGALSQGIYVLLGLFGLPIFTLGGGFSYLAQPTFGFLLGLIPAAWLIGKMTQTAGNGFWRLALACLAGTGVLYLIGLPYMYGILTLYLKAGWTLGKTIWSGMVIFLPWDILKIAVAAMLAKKLLPILDRVR